MKEIKIIKNTGIFFNLKLIPLDKKLHLGVGFVISILFGIIFCSTITGLVISGLAGVVKEIYDKFHPSKHTSEMSDIVATLSGGILGCLFLNFLIWMLDMDKLNDLWIEMCLQTFNEMIKMCTRGIFYR